MIEVIVMAFGLAIMNWSYVITDTLIRRWRARRKPPTDD